MVLPAIFGGLLLGARFAIPKLARFVPKILSFLGRKAVVPAIKGVGRVIVPKTFKGAVATAIIAPVAFQVIKESPIVRKRAIALVNPLDVGKAELGKDIARIIEGEKPKAPVDIKRGLKVAGIIGAGIGAIVVAPKVARKVKGIFDKPKALLPASQVEIQPARPLVPSQLPTAIETQTIPGAVKIKPKPSPRMMRPMVHITNINQNQIMIQR